MAFTFDRMQINQHLSHDSVRTYYGETLASSADLKTSACCSLEDLSPRYRETLALLEDEVTDRFYGCGSPIPPALDGCTVLDLGCGTGRDAFVAARLAGPTGHVIGVDMTEEQLAVARRHERVHAERFGFEAPNTSFRLALIEDLRSAGVEDGSVDVAISNCVVNLSPDKRRVLAEVHRVLRSGGEFYFSDVFVDRRLPAEFAHDPILLGECLGGALYTEDFRRIMAEIGFQDVRVVTERPITIDDPAIAARVGNSSFISRTVRAFKLDSLEDRCEDYGQVAWYLGGIQDAPHQFELDDHHVFEAGRPMLVCGNTASMLQETRFAPNFRIDGDRSTHFGQFECASADTAGSSPAGCC